jgi:hypothetical protein
VRVRGEALVGAEDASVAQERFVVGVVEGGGRGVVEVDDHARVQVESGAGVAQVRCEGGVERGIGWLVVDAVQELRAVDEPDRVAAG